jgi:hypothetical protein
MSVSVGGSGVPTQRKTEKWDVETICEQNGFVNGYNFGAYPMLKGKRKSPFECPFASMEPSRNRDYR